MSEEQQEDSLKWGDGNSIGGDEGFSFDYFDNAGLKEYSESSLSLSSPYVLCSPLLVLVVLILLLA
jgi:hypothetical protein